MSHSTALDKIGREFGSQEKVIERAFISCPSFRTLCGDYVACSLTLARFRQSGSKEACLREAEHSELLQDLAAEIETRLWSMGLVSGDSATGCHPGAEQGLGR
jgi:hypothetical protein